MKLVYVAHPYGGKAENAEKVDVIIKELYREYPYVSFVSPIHGIRCGYHDAAVHEGLAYCLELMSRCDEVLLCGVWTKSTGCTAEAALAYKLGMKIGYQNQWLQPNR